MNNTTFFKVAPGVRLFLASSSPRRKEMLANLGLEFQIVTSDIPEPQPEPGESCKRLAGRAARCKCSSVLNFLSGKSLSTKVIIAADTVVCADNQIFGKPKDTADAFEMLCQLNGKIHKVSTALCLQIISASRNFRKSFVTTSKVEFAKWSEHVLRAYAQTEEPLDKAGSYAVQGKGAFLIKKITGSWTNVVGLPLETLTSFLLTQKLIYPVAHFA